MIEQEKPADSIKKPRHLRVSGLVPHLSSRLAAHPIAQRLARTRRKPSFFKRIQHFIVRYRLQYITGIILIVLLVLQVAIFAANMLIGTQPILGLRFRGQNITHYSRARLVRLVDEAIGQVERDPLVVQAATSHTRLTARQLGARYSTDSIVSAIYSTGREGSLWNQLAVQDASLFGNYGFRLGFPNINTGLTWDFLLKINDVIKRLPTNAAVTLKNSHLSIVPGVPGYQLDIAGSVKALKNYDESLDMNLVKLPLKPLPPVIGEKDVRELFPQLKRMTDSPLQVKAGSFTAVVSRNALVNTLTIENKPDPRHPTRNKPVIVIDQTDADKISAALARQLDHDAEPRIMDGQTVVKAGKDGDVVDGLQTKVGLISQLLLRQQQVVDGNKPLNLAIHHIKAPLLPKLPDPQLYGGALSAYKGQAGRVILSFEGMPNATYGAQLLDVLKRYNVHAVFFGVGRNVTSYPDVVKRIVSEGHVLGASTFSYRDVTELSGSSLREDIEQSVAAIVKVTGDRPILFRSPYGGSSDAADALLKQQHLQSLTWTLDTFDWGNLPASFIASRVLANARPGSVVLLHALNEQTVTALPQIIDGLKKRGYTL